jgi:hypothetical protein
VTKRMKKSSKTDSGRFLRRAGGFALGWGLCLLTSVFVLLNPVIAVVAACLALAGIFSKWMFARWIVFGYVFRLATVLGVVLILFNSPRAMRFTLHWPHVESVSFGLFFFHEIGLAEGAVRHYCSSVETAEYDGKDPFTGRDFLQSPSRQFYSVGPDLTDDSLEIPYDPTNGMVSQGDIVINPPRP